MVSLPLLSLVVLAIACSEVKASKTGKPYGEGVTNTNQEEFYKQICPQGDQESKFVRIKTFNNKYIWAYATHKGDASYLRTRCCGATDNHGRKDVTTPSRHTTFKLHCANGRGGQKVVRFEILDKRNKPSGYFFYAYAAYDSGIYAYKFYRKAAHMFNFILERWRGPVVAIRTEGKQAGSSKEMSNWLTFVEYEHGYVSGFAKPYHRYPKIPSIAETFTLESVPSGCVEGLYWNVDGYRMRAPILAAPKNTDSKECERKGFCYWTSDWDHNARQMEKGTCGFDKDSQCWWDNGEKLAQYNLVGSKCTEAGYCFDYHYWFCYKRP